MSALFTRKRFIAAMVASSWRWPLAAPSRRGEGRGAGRRAKASYKIGWSIYAGWMPWPYAQQAGIVKKWADKYGIKINIVQVNDYVEIGEPVHRRQARRRDRRPTWTR